METPRISLITVVIRGMEEYLRVLRHTIATQTSLVREVIIIKIDSEETRLRACWKEGEIEFQFWDHALFNEPNKLYKPFAQMVAGHALGLHYGLERASQPYVWFCDPDIFLLGPTDRLFLEFMAEHDLDLIGVSHFSPNDQCYLDFPCVVSLLTKRSSLPDAQWLAGELFIQSAMTEAERGEKLLPMDGRYLLPGLNSHWREFPNPNGTFDIGCNLWLWNRQNQGRWVSFQTKEKPFSHGNFGLPQLVYPFNYTTGQVRSNFGLIENLADEPLLYHRTRGSREFAHEYLNLYQSLFGPTPNFPITV